MRMAKSRRLSQTSAGKAEPEAAIGFARGAWAARRRLRVVRAAKIHGSAFCARGGWAARRSLGAVRVAKPHGTRPRSAALPDR